MARRSGRLSEAALRWRLEGISAGRCEYCHAPQRICGYRFHLEHVIPRSQGGADALENRAFACAACNLAKGDRSVATDPDTGVEAALFNPRTQLWGEHFRCEEGAPIVVGLTPSGRATVAALKMNGEPRQEARRLWVKFGLFP